MVIDETIVLGNVKQTKELVMNINKNGSNPSKLWPHFVLDKKIVQAYYNPHLTQEPSMKNPDGSMIEERSSSGIAEDARRLVAKAEAMPGGSVQPEKLIRRERAEGKERELADLTAEIHKLWAEVMPGELSPDNLKLLQEPSLKTDYDHCASFLQRAKLDDGMPTFEEAMAVLKSFGNRKLDVLRNRDERHGIYLEEDLKLVMAPKMGYGELSDCTRNELANAEISFNSDIYTGGRSEGVAEYSVGLVVAGCEPDADLGQLHDGVSLLLDQDGLRFPQGPEYIVLWHIMKEEGHAIDEKRDTILDSGKVGNKLVPLGSPSVIWESEELGEMQIPLREVEVSPFSMKGRKLIVSNPKPGLTYRTPSSVEGLGFNLRVSGWGTFRRKK